MSKTDATQFVKWTQDLGAAKRNIPLEMIKGLREGMKKVKKTSQRSYLSGPRGMKVAIRTGRLRKSLLAGAKAKGDILEGSLSTKVFYGRFFEDGTKRRVAMPFMAPAFKDEENSLTTLLERAGIKVFKA
jgi:hypothetical protein